MEDSGRSNLCRVDTTANAQWSSNPATKKMPIEVIDSMGNEIIGAEEGIWHPSIGENPCRTVVSPILMMA